MYSTVCLCNRSNTFAASTVFRSRYRARNTTDSLLLSRQNTTTPADPAQRMRQGRSKVTAPIFLCLQNYSQTGCCFQFFTKCFSLACPSPSLAPLVPLQFYVVLSFTLFWDFSIYYFYYIIRRASPPKQWLCLRHTPAKWPPISHSGKCAMGWRRAFAIHRLVLGDPREQRPSTGVAGVWLSVFNSSFCFNCCQWSSQSKYVCVWLLCALLNTPSVRTPAPQWQIPCFKLMVIILK